MAMSHFCSMTRRQLFASFTAAATSASLGAVGAAQSAEPAGGASPPVILGNGEYRYQVVGNWGELPPGYTYGDSAAVCVGSKDNVYVFTRGSHPVIVFDRNGKFLRSWGEDIGFTNAHGAAVGPDDMLYLTDDFGHAVRKCTTDGKVALTIGTPKKSAPAFSGEPFNRCTHTALSPQGDIYVSDGYANARVHKYSPDGKLLFSWGEPGVYVADRENHRVQVFDGNGKYEAQWHNLMRPCGLCVTRGKKPIAVIGELGPETVASLTKGVRNLGPRLSVVSAKGETLAHLGTEPIGEGLGQFIAPHGVALDSRGDIYVAEVANTYWPILFGTKPDHELRSLQKLVRMS
jgi:DNA-binding beta-propeller fold protein YncE